MRNGTSGRDRLVKITVTQKQFFCQRRVLPSYRFLSSNKILSETCLLIISVKALKWREVGRQKEEGCSHGLGSRENSLESHSAYRSPKGRLEGARNAVVLGVEQRAEGPTPRGSFGAQDEEGLFIMESGQSWERSPGRQPVPTSK